MALATGLGCSAPGPVATYEAQGRYMERGDATGWLSTLETDTDPDIRSHRDDVAAWIRGFAELREAVTATYGRNEIASITRVLGPIPHPDEVGRYRQDRVRNELLTLRKHNGGLVTVDGIPYVQRGGRWLERAVRPSNLLQGPVAASNREQDFRTLGDAGRAAIATAARLRSGRYSERQAATILSWEHFKVTARPVNRPTLGTSDAPAVTVRPITIDLSTPRQTFETYARALAAADPEAMLACYQTDRPGARQYFDAYARLLASSARLRRAADARFGEQEAAWLIGSIGPYVPAHGGERILEDLEQAEFNIDGDTAHVRYPQSSRTPDRMARIGDTWKFEPTQGKPAATDPVQVPPEFEFATARNERLAVAIETGLLTSPLDASLSVIQGDGG